ncbi:long-chain fatty acid--CoA ligase, partial [Thermus scotoductus]|uniref:AMP-binding protein n=1 Tax=Thermus scotoductus TaxID=37636 RepID=UPI0010011CFB
LYDPGVPKASPRPWLLTDLLRFTARRYPHKTALPFLGRILHYLNLWPQVEAFAKGLQEAGLKPGDRVAIMLPTSPQFVIAFYGTLLAGGLAVNTHPPYTPRELGLHLRDSGAKILVLLDLLLPRYQEVKANAPVEGLLPTGIQDNRPFPK